MVSRWHLDLAAVALVLGVLVALVVAVMGHISPVGGAGRVVPGLRGRMIAVAGLLGALLGTMSPLGQAGSRSWPWVVAAALVVVPGDGGRYVHPLGRAVVAMTVASLIGVWSAVPDTEPALAVGAVLVPMALLILVDFVGLAISVGPVSTIALIVAIVGSVWVGSAGWGSALAVVFVVGMVAVVPMVVGFRPVDPTGRDRGALDRTARTVLIAVHVVAVLVLPRVAMRRSVSVAVAIALGVIAVMVILIVVADRVAPANRVAPADRVTPRDQRPTQ